MARNLYVLLLSGIAFAGCAPREAYYRPADRRALGRDGFVGAHYRVPPGAADGGAGAVAALSPLARSKSDANKAGITALIDFRNKRKAAVVFLPGSVTLRPGASKPYRPTSIIRGKRPARKEESIPYWHRASFTARFELPVAGMAEQAWTLSWKYRCAGKSYVQQTRFTATDSKLAERSLSGVPDGLVTDAGYSGASGVPFLMNIPFVGALFRSGTTGGSRTVTTVGPGGATARGTWWPLEPERSR